MRIVAASGYMNPCHKGHIEYLERAKQLGDKLIVIVNNDFQVKLKGSKEFMDEEERLLIIRSLRCVDMAILAVDRDPTVCETLKIVRPHIFAKGGDRYTYEIPESKICRELGISIVDGLGEKIQSSSWLLGK